MVMKYFIFLTIIGMAIAGLPRNVVDDTPNRLPPELDNSEKQLAEATNTTVKQDIFDPRIQSFIRECIERIQSIIKIYMPRLNEIAKKNPEFKRFKDGFSSFNGKEKRGIFTNIMKKFENFGFGWLLKSATQQVVREKLVDGLEEVAKTMIDVVEKIFS